MSRHNENESGEEFQGTPAFNDAPVLRAIEEHASALKVSAPVFAAVRQAKGWADGRKVEKAEFEKAVADFLNAPAGGV